MTRVAACQISLSIENPAGNISHANQGIAEAISQGAQIIVLPELTNSGYVFTSVSEVQDRSTTLDGATWQTQSIGFTIEARQENVKPRSVAAQR